MIKYFKLFFIYEFGSVLSARNSFCLRARKLLSCWPLLLQLKSQRAQEILQKICFTTEFQLRDDDDDDDY